MTQTTRISRPLLILAAVFALLAAGIVAVQAVGTSDSPVIHACQDKQGALRVVADSSACRRNETPLSWNKTGPAGPAGSGGGISDYTVVRGEYTPWIPQHNTGHATAVCPAGTMPLGAGYDSFDNYDNTGVNFQIYHNYPDGQEWRISIRNTGTEPIRFNVVVTCGGVADQ